VKRRLAFGCVAALALFAVFALEGTALDVAKSFAAAGSPSNGKIAFSEPSSSEGFLALPSDLYVIDADGSHRERLSECPNHNCVVRAFAWSPNGRRLAFVRGGMGGIDSGPNLSLYVVDADGGRQRRISGCGKPRWPSCGDFGGSQISWSPDSSRVVLPRGRSLYVFNIDRDSFRRLTNCGTRTCFDMHPAWAADGSRILFVRFHTPYSESIHSVAPDGSHLKRLTKLHGSARNPAWSPDGRRIAFDATDGLSDRLFVTAAGKSPPRLLHSGPSGTGPGVPAWSPNGRWIAYLTTPGTPGSFRAAVRVVRPNGTDRRLLYRSACCIETWGRPIWSPDGKYVAFGVGLRSSAARSGIFVIRADGTGLRRVATAPTEAAWQRIP
jgi:Tol biopolymer transport system component